MMLSSTLPGVVLPLSRPASSAEAQAYARPLPTNHQHQLGDASAGFGFVSSSTLSFPGQLSDFRFRRQSTHFPRSLSLLAPTGPHSRHSSSASSLPSASTSISSPADSPPSATSTTKNTIASIPRTTIRRARTGTSPYPREAHIHTGSDVYSSSSETEDFQMFHHPTLNSAHHLHPASDGYQNMYMHPSVAHIDPMQSVQQHQAYGRIAMSQDHNLEQLASNVRSATTTSASDRAKQIFVHAWSVLAF